MKKNRKYFFTIIGVLIVVLTAIFLLWRRPAEISGPPQKVILGVDFSDTFSSPILIAENQGFFREQGLVVKIIEYSSGRTALADMIAKKKLDVVTCAQTPVMYNSFSCNNYAVIAGFAQSYEAGSLLLASKDKGINTVSDLKGRRIGTPMGSTGHFFLNLFLMFNGLNIHDVEIIDIDAPNLPSTIAKGQVDAIAAWQPGIYNAQKLLGENAVILFSNNIYRVDFYLVPNNDFLKQNTETLKRLLKAIDKAEDYIMENREQSIDIVSNRMKMDKKIIAAIWDQYQFKLFLDQAVLTDLEAEGRWAIENKYANATTLPDYRNFIYPGILETIKPESVNIIR